MPSPHNRYRELPEDVEEDAAGDGDGDGYLQDEQDAAAKGGVPSQDTADNLKESTATDDRNLQSNVHDRWIDKQANSRHVCGLMSRPSPGSVGQPDSAYGTLAPPVGSQSHHDSRDGSLIEEDASCSENIAPPGGSQPHTAQDQGKLTIGIDKPFFGRQSSGGHSTTTGLNQSSTRIHSVVKSSPGSPENPWDTITIHKSEYPQQLRLPQLDVLLVYSDQDRDEAIAAMESLIKELNITLSDGTHISFCSIHTILPNFSKIQSLGTLMSCCNFYFLYVTEKFVNCSWSDLQKDNLLMASIEDADKQWSVIPVYRHARHSRAPFTIPFGLRALKGMYLSDIGDKYFRSNLESLFNDKLYMKKTREREMTRQLHRWISREKHERHLKQVEEEEYRQQQDDLRRKTEEVEKMKRRNEFQDRERQISLERMQLHEHELQQKMLQKERQEKLRQIEEQKSLEQQRQLQEQTEQQVKNATMTSYGHQLPHLSSDAKRQQEAIMALMKQQIALNECQGTGDIRMQQQMFQMMQSLMTSPSMPVEPLSHVEGDRNTSYQSLNGNIEHSIDEEPTNNSLPPSYSTVYSAKFGLPKIQTEIQEKCVPPKPEFARRGSHDVYTSDSGAHKVMDEAMELSPGRPRRTVSGPSAIPNTEYERNLRENSLETDQSSVSIPTQGAAENTSVKFPDANQPKVKVSTSKEEIDKKVEVHTHVHYHMAGSGTSTSVTIKDTEGLKMQIGDHNALVDGTLTDENEYPPNIGPDPADSEGVEVAVTGEGKEHDVTSPDDTKDISQKTLSQTTLNIAASDTQAETDKPTAGAIGGPESTNEGALFDTRSGVRLHEQETGISSSSSTHTVHPPVTPCRKLKPLENPQAPVNTPVGLVSPVMFPGSSNLKTSADKRNTDRKRILDQSNNATITQQHNLLSCQYDSASLTNGDDYPGSVGPPDLIERPGQFKDSRRRRDVGQPPLNSSTKLDIESHQNPGRLASIEAHQSVSSTSPNAIPYSVNSETAQKYVSVCPLGSHLSSPSIVSVNRVEFVSQTVDVTRSQGPSIFSSQSTQNPNIPTPTRGAVSTSQSVEIMSREMVALGLRGPPSDNRPRPRVPETVPEYLAGQFESSDSEAHTRLCDEVLSHPWTSTTAPVSGVTSGVTSRLAQSGRDEDEPSDSFEISSLDLAEYGIGSSSVILDLSDDRLVDTLSAKAPDVVARAQYGVSSQMQLMASSQRQGGALTEAHYRGAVAQCPPTTDSISSSPSDGSIQNGGCHTASFSPEPSTVSKPNNTQANRTVYVDSHKQSASGTGLKQTKCVIQ